MNYEERLTAIKKKIQEATIQQAKWQHELETAQASANELTRKMIDKFSVHTIDEAKDLLAQWSAQLSLMLTEAEDQLEKLRNDS